MTITLTSKIFGDRQVIFDDCDYDLIKDLKWSLSGYHKGGNCYARTHSSTKGGKKLKVRPMHRLILGITDPKIKIDHKNGNGCDNRRDNLRIATSAQNSSNAAIYSNKIVPFKGVSKAIIKNNTYYSSRISHNKRTIWLGYYKTAEQAALAYNEGAKKYHGDFARLNEFIIDPNRA